VGGSSLTFISAAVEATLQVNITHEYYQWILPVNIAKFSAAQSSAAKKISSSVSSI
jgi:hypothetical protein